MKQIENKVKSIYQFFINSGCCKRCALRYVLDEPNFNNPEEDTKELSDDEEIVEIKKIKLNPCVICLDLLQDLTIETMVLDLELQKILEYDSETFVNFISFPSAISIREHAMEIVAKEKFFDFFKDKFITPVNKAWSLSIQQKLSEKIHKTFDKYSTLQIQFNTSYEQEDEESSVILKIKPTKCLSRSVVGVILDSISVDEFKKHVSIPSKPPSVLIKFDNITFKHEFIYLGGRYCKYSRNIFQTPWITEDETIVLSVQEIIFKAVGDTFKSTSLVFSSSGREDFDVRMLGRGRPFYIKIINPKITKISFEKFREIERQIFDTKIVKVSDLQMVDKKLISHIKEGEQFKQKTYRALCIIKNLINVDSYIEKINQMTEIIIQQRTPVRVLHRRSADTREKKIYKIKAKSVTDRSNLFEIEVLTQAGTYVKEFVHGDLGRTKPSLSSIIGCNVDIVALDVLNIHLNFPPKIKQK